MSDSHYNPCLISRKPWLARLGDASNGYINTTGNKLDVVDVKVQA